ncbi:MAG: hypothetical protein ACYCQJ_13675 [Nitrososphaerales archaeon]
MYNQATLFLYIHPEAKELPLVDLPPLVQLFLPRLSYLEDSILYQIRDHLILLSPKAVVWIYGDTIRLAKKDSSELIFLGEDEDIDRLEDNHTITYGKEDDRPYAKQTADDRGRRLRLEAYDGSLTLVSDFTSTKYKGYYPDYLEYYSNFQRAFHLVPYYRETRRTLLENNEIVYQVKYDPVGNIVSETEWNDLSPPWVRYSPIHQRVKAKL